MLLWIHQLQLHFRYNRNTLFLTSDNIIPSTTYNSTPQNTSHQPQLKTPENTPTFTPNLIQVKKSFNLNFINNYLKSSDLIMSYLIPLLKSKSNNLSTKIIEILRSIIPFLRRQSYIDPQSSMYP